MEFVDPRTLSRHNPTPPSRDTVTYPLRWGEKLTFGDDSTIIAKFCGFQSTAQVALVHLWQKTLILFNASSYIDQGKKTFVRGRNACLKELEKKHGVKISDSTLKI